MPRLPWVIRRRRPVTGPVTGYKRTGIMLIDGVPRLYSRAWGTPYESDGFAVCLGAEPGLLGPHGLARVPDAEHGCGFSAVTDRALVPASTLTATALVTVELDGKIVSEDRDGLRLRGERQRLVAAELDARCHRCPADARAPADWLQAAAVPMRHISPPVRSLFGASGSSRAGASPEPTYADLRPVCDLHARTLPSVRHELTLLLHPAELPERFGLPVSWTRP